MIKEYIKVQLNELIPHARNPRKNDGAVEAVSKSIKETGYITPIIVDEKNEILCGHTRAKSLKKLGHSEVEVLKVTGLTDEQKKRYRILDNKTGEVAEWDFEILQEDFKLDELVGLGFDIKDLDQGEVIEDEAPPIPETPKTVNGDIYELNGHRVMCGDSTIITDVEKLMDGQKADMVFTDPPYGVNYEGGHFHSGNVSIVRKREKLAYDLDSNIYSEVIPIIASICDGPCYTWFAGTKSFKLFEAIENIKANIHSMLIWHKTNATYAAMNMQYKQRHEPCLYWTAKNAKTNWCGKSTENSLWEIKRDSINKYHPTQKPVELAYRAIMNHSVGLIVDLFLGSGSTLIACEQTNRKCYGMELDEKYCDVIVQRWVNFTKQTKIKRNGIDMEWPTNNQETTKNA